MSHPTHSEEIVEEISQSVRRKRLFVNRILVYIADDASRQSVDSWAKAVLEDVTTWPLEKPFLALHHFQAIGLTPYNRQIGQEVARQFPDTLHGRYATLISRGAIGYAVKLFGTSQLNKILPQLESAFFFDYDIALAWLKEKIE